MDTKKCKGCNKIKDKSDFYGRDIKCKECKSSEQKDRIKHKKDLTKTLNEKIDKIQDINNKLIESLLQKDLEIQNLTKEINKLKIDKQKK